MMILLLVVMPSMSKGGKMFVSGADVSTGDALDAADGTAFAMPIDEDPKDAKPRKDTWKGSYHYHKMLNIDYPYETDISYHENGNKMYEGQWKDGKRHGGGISYWENGKVLYSGQWQNGEEHGNGTLYNEYGFLCQSLFLD
jgi:hypothetical protein